ncbi:cobalt-precorrin-6A reductase [Beijerinckia indica]|uniref:Precorrin-6x reductase n=1 Tax=Beijerinckia indica subsp. indica (strain ATCC 9039 / DSM 1715 / NCIMB 8712) TaxID=395963 RepID=B2IFG9_BEII9|nr:cobalt-precorrin-6A reductase [Beijerinckia indica]ACB97069.1 precorrin-6x reductase [Beijerinckia indica subsp. indica ATCC 9039]
MKQILLLGGTSEASALAKMLARRPDLACLLSLAGRTSAPVAPPISFRIGGFGGIAGLVAFLRDHKIDVLVDATHPFAAIMSDHARVAAREAGVKLITLTRAPWREQEGDHWISVPDMKAATQVLGPIPRRVFLTIGRLQVEAFVMAPQHFYLIRTIEPVEDLPLPDYHVIQDRGPFDAEREAALLVAERIDCLVTKNSGGAATYGKILAARRLGLPVIMVERPETESSAAMVVHAPADVLDLIDAHEVTPMPRGV